MKRELQLSDGTSLPSLGLGTWKSKPNEVYKAVRRAFEVGYRHIDCAAIYSNEAEVGQAFRDAFQAGDVSREDVWVTSKLWNDNHEPHRVRPALEKTLNDLGLEQLDLYLVHWPIAHRAGAILPQGPADLISPEELPLEKTWEAMLEVKASGLCRQVGVSNFSLQKVRSLKSVGEMPAMNQVELHPYLQQSKLVDGCRAEGVAVTAYSPLGSPDSASLLKRVDKDPLLKNETIKTIAEARGATIGQVLISWALHRETIVIPKSTNPARILENFQSQDLSLTEEDMKTIAALDRHHRMLDGAVFLKSPAYTLQSLWDE